MAMSTSATRSRLGRAAISTGISSVLIGATLGVVALTSTANATTPTTGGGGTNATDCKDAGLSGEVVLHGEGSASNDFVAVVVSEPGHEFLDVELLNDALTITGTVVKGADDFAVYPGDPVPNMHAPEKNGHFPEISHWYVCGEFGGPSTPPTGEPTDEPTGEPTDEPTSTPTEEPTPTPTDEPTPTPTDEPTATPPPELGLSVLSPICDNDVPYLEYEVDASDFPDADSVTITWLNPDGDDVVLADQPLTGRVLWAGAEADEDGNPLDWPGWRFEDGVWVEGDEFDWVRPSVEVLFEVNPEITVTVDYPPSSPLCNANPPGEEPSDEPTPGEPLPDTGAGTGTGVALGAAILIAGGAVLTLYGRRVSRQSI